MAQVSLRELRRYGELFEEARLATKGGQLADIADRTDQQLKHWLLRESMKDKLAERARRLGLPCRADPQDCFDYLLGLARPQLGLFRKDNPTRDGLAAVLTDWAVANIREMVGAHRKVASFESRMKTEDGRPIDIDLNVENFWPHLDVVGRFSGPVADDAAAAWAGLVELDVRVDEYFDDWAELRTVLARTIRHELEHAHDVGIPQVRVPEGISDFEVFRRYILSPREISAWSAHITEEAEREGRDLRSMLEANRRIVAEGAVRRGATRAQANDLAKEVAGAWSETLGRHLTNPYRRAIEEIPLS